MTVDNSEQGSSTVTQALDSVEAYLCKAEHRRTEEDECNVEAAMHHIRSFMMKASSEQSELVLALRDAWPYVQAGCESDSMKERISAVMRKHGNGDSWAPAGNDEPGEHSSHGSAPERLVHARPRPGAAP